MNLMVNISENKYANFLIKSLIIISIFCIPYDAMHVFPSTYRPLLIYPALALFVLLVPKIISKFDKASFYLMIFYVISNLLSVIMKYIYNYPSSFFYEYFVTSTLGVILFLTFNTSFRYLSKNNEDLSGKIIKMICVAYTFPIIIAFLDFLSINGLLPINISKYIHIIFGGGQTNRVCGFTLEASWLTMHLLFALTCFFYCIKRGLLGKKFIFFVVLSLIIVLFSFSLLAYLYILVFTIVAYIIAIRKKITILRLVFPILFFVLVIVFFEILGNYASDTYYGNRFRNLSFSYMINNDTSAFIRFINPEISILMFLKNPVVGTGAGYYPLNYEHYILKYHSNILNLFGGNNEVVKLINDSTANSKCLYFRVLGENGIFGFLFLLFVIQCVKNGNKNNNDSLLIYIILATLILPIQFDSMCYTIFFVILALYNNVRGRDNDWNYISEFQQY